MFFHLPRIPQQHGVQNISWRRTGIGNKSVGCLTKHVCQKLTQHLSNSKMSFISFPPVYRLKIVMRPKWIITPDFQTLRIKTHSFEVWNLWHLGKYGCKYHIILTLSSSNIHREKRPWDSLQMKLKDGNEGWTVCHLFWSDMKKLFEFVWRRSEQSRTDGRLG